MDTKAIRGFTLIEMMIAVLIAAIILAMALPGFRNLSSNNRLASHINEFVVSAMLARSEAVKRGTPVVLSSISGTGDWQPGWRVMVGSQILQQVDALSGSVTFTSSGSIASFTYLPTGRATATDTLDLCDDRSGEVGRSAVIGLSGRVSVADKACS